MRVYKMFLAAATAASLISCGSSDCETECFVEADDPVALSQEEESAWNTVGRNLHAAWVSPDFRYGRSRVPETEGIDTLRLSVWKGERASAQLLLWSSEAKDGVGCSVGVFRSGDSELPSSAAQARFVRYTLADRKMEKFTRGGQPVLSPDMLDSLKVFDMDARTTRPVWITVNVPQDADAGIYTSEIELTHNGGGKVTLPMELEVVDRVLATPDKWDYHLDLWQHPSSVARIQGLEMWSDAHFEALKPVMKRLADAGQKVITATLNKDPWNHQCYDAYEPMILWTRHEDGSWSYDYSVFDRWVRLMLDLGIDRFINCYSMVPWNCEIEYHDEAEGKTVTVKAEPGTDVFTEIWRPFLLDFKSHLKAEGWLGITNIAMDERSPEAMSAAADLLMECAPEMGFALADNHRSYKKFTIMRDVCVAIHHDIVSSEDIRSRREKGFVTSFYVCCDPMYPNTFTSSQPYEAAMLGWYSVAHDYDGMLRWAYNSWPEDPQYDSRYQSWMSGDTFLVYPYDRSSIRFERLIDGIEVAEKVRQLRKEGVDLSPLESVLEKMRSMDAHDPSLPWQEVVAEAESALAQVSRRQTISF